MAVFSSLCGLWRKRERHRDNAGVDGEIDGGDDDDTSSLFFELESLQLATNFFSELNKLGHGGFGPVYRGLLPSGQEIAVKKLSVNSRQGVEQFINEVKLLLNMVHKNLVVLLGCCIEGPEKMLVYEYLPNKSLDYFIFDSTKSKVLDWPRRYKIITNVARGLLYLHEEARERIIHRDIKASNILLDDHLNPKISDFGLARLFPGDDTHMETFRISGTYGYMAPEYTMKGILSVKTDVFSFGVLMLEIVSGRKNYDKYLGPEKADLLSYAWTLYKEGKSLELVDSNISNFSPDEIALCVQVSLLCCQATYSDRPTMAAVILMLSNDSFTLPRPRKPGIHGRLGQCTTATTTKSTSVFTASNQTPSSQTNTAGTRSTRVNSSVEDLSRNSISISSTDEGR